MSDDATDGHEGSTAGDATPSDEEAETAGDGARSDDADTPLGGLADRRQARREEQESTETDPFAALDRETAAEGDPATDSAPAASGDAFEQMDVEPVDSEDVWADLLDDETDEAAAADGPAAQAATADAAERDAAAGGATGGASASTAVTADAAPAEAETAADAAGTGPEADHRAEHVIPKADYCQRCVYFSDPPDVACGHEGTDIVSVEDFEHFRVRGCPVVENEFEPDDR
jgi:hypothetical protein